MAIALSALSRVANMAKGSFGIVDVCLHAETQTVYAVKRIRKKRLFRHGTDLTELAWMEREVMTRNRDCTHPGSVFLATLDAALQDATHIFLVMQFFRGGDLDQLKKNSKLSLSASLFYLAEVVLGLAALHSMSIYHRDIKLNNIIIDSEGHAVLADFGMAINASDHRSWGKCGSYGYRAPEVVLELECGAAADIYSLGVAFYILLEGEMPFTTTLKRVANQLPLKFNSTNLLARDLCEKMLEVSQDYRISLEEIMAHPIFGQLDWNTMGEKAYEVPWVPPSIDICTLEGRALSRKDDVDDEKYRLPDQLDRKFDGWAWQVGNAPGAQFEQEGQPEVMVKAPLSNTRTLDREHHRSNTRTLDREHHSSSNESKSRRIRPSNESKNRGISSSNESKSRRIHPESTTRGTSSSNESKSRRIRPESTTRGTSSSNESKSRRIRPESKSRGTSCSPIEHNSRKLSSLSNESKNRGISSKESQYRRLSSHHRAKHIGSKSCGTSPSNESKNRGISSSNESKSRRIRPESKSRGTSPESKSCGTSPIEHNSRKLSSLSNESKNRGIRISRFFNTFSKRANLSYKAEEMESESPQNRRVRSSSKPKSKLAKINGNATNDTNTNDPSSDYASVPSDSGAPGTPIMRSRRAKTHDSSGSQPKSSSVDEDGQQRGLSPKVGLIEKLKGGRVKLDSLPNDDKLRHTKIFQRKPLGKG